MKRFYSSIIRGLLEGMLSDESKITRDRHSMPMTIQTSVTHLLRALIIKVTDGATITSEMCASEFLFMTH